VLYQILKRVEEGIELLNLSLNILRNFTVHEIIFVCLHMKDVGKQLNLNVKSESMYVPDCK
jgi:hypothetical protein